MFSSAPLTLVNYMKVMNLTNLFLRPKNENYELDGTNFITSNSSIRLKIIMLFEKSKSLSNLIIKQLLKL